MKITWINTDGINGAYRDLHICCCRLNLLCCKYWATECADITQLFDFTGYCQCCGKEGTIRQWLGYEAVELYHRICIAHPEWPPGDWRSIGKKETPQKDKEDVDARLKRLLDENLARAFG